MSFIVEDDNIVSGKISLKQQFDEDESTSQKFSVKKISECQQLFAKYDNISSKITLKLSQKQLPMIQEFELEELGILRLYVKPISDNFGKQTSNLVNKDGRF